MQLDITEGERKALIIALESELVTARCHVAIGFVGEQARVNNMESLISKVKERR